MIATAAAASAAAWAAASIEISVAPPVVFVVEVTVNGQDYSADGQQFTYYGLLPPELSPPLVALPSPPVGPTEGATLVVLEGSGLAGAGPSHCAFGGVQVAGTVDSEASTLACVTPAALAAQAKAVPVSVSLNGQQWMPLGVNFTYLLPTRLSSLLPDISPNTGGMVVELLGAALGGGSGYRCRFDEAGSAHSPPVAADVVVEGTFDESGGSVLCVTPAAVLGRVAVRVSLNAQQYSPRADAATMLFYDVDDIETIEPYGEERAEVAPPPPPPQTPYARGFAAINPQEMGLGLRPSGTYISLDADPGYHGVHILPPKLQEVVED